MLDNSVSGYGGVFRVLVCGVKSECPIRYAESWRPCGVLWKIWSALRRRERVGHRRRVAHKGIRATRGPHSCSAPLNRRALHTLVKIQRLGRPRSILDADSRSDCCDHRNLRFAETSAVHQRGSPARWRLLSYRQILVTAGPVRRRRFGADGRSAWR